jgi:hypothetical protein
MDAGYVAFLKALQYQQGAVRGKLHTTACYFRRNWVISSLREALRARYSEKWELENLLVNLEFDSFQLSGECVTILHEPMRTPVQTFCV